LSDRARLYADEVSVQRTAERHLDLYQEVIARVRGEGAII
jgi:hypothetical protein